MGRRGSIEGVVDRPPWANLSLTQQLISASLFVVAYVLAAAASRSFELPNGVSAWYPPAAIVFAYLLVAGPRYLPVAATVSVVSDVVQYPDNLDRQGFLVLLVGASLGAAVYAWGAWVLRHNRLDHARLRQFGWFAMIGVAACPLLAAGAYALVQITLADASVQVAFDEASTFWIGDSVAIVSIVPFILLAAYTRRHGTNTVGPPMELPGRIELVAQAVAVVVVPVAIFAVRGAEEIVPFLFLAMIPVVWVALRQNLLIASFGVLVTNTLVAIGARLELGVTDDFIAVQTLMLTAALAALYAGALRRTENEHLAQTMESEARYRTLLESSPALVARFDLEGAVDVQAGRLDPATPGDAVVAELERRWPELDPAVTDGATTDLEWTLATDDETRWLETRAVVERSLDGTAASVLTVTSDRTTIHRAAEQLAAMARRDAVTGLPNRVAMEELIEAGPPEGAEPHVVVAVLLDRAEVVLAGRDRGVVDAIAIAIADRLGATLASGDVLARLGATSYAVLTSAGPRAAELAHAAVAAMADPFELDGTDTYLHSSAGVCAPLEDGEPATIEHAELAARLAQDAGGARVAHFAPSMVTAVADTRALIDGLRGGLTRSELVVHYQPIVALPGGEILGAEALVRWQRPGHGLVGPVHFIEAAERSGLIDDIGAAVERIVSAELLANRSALPASSFAVNLNVSVHQLLSRSFPERITRMLGAFTAAGLELRLELTETAILTDPTQAIAVLEDLRARGACIVLDDFGTGFSAISWLHQLPVDALKLDRSFVTGLPDDHASMRIAQLVTALAAELELDLTAEGIETEAQRDALVELGCTRAQGYLFDRPLPLRDLLQRLA